VAAGEPSASCHKHDGGCGESVQACDRRIAVSDTTRRRQYADSNVMASVSKHHDQQAAPRVVVKPHLVTLP
jgi:hypothetical protein